MLSSLFSVVKRMPIDQNVQLTKSALQLAVHVPVCVCLCVANI